MRIKAISCCFALLLLSSAGIVSADYEEGVNAAFKGEFDIAFHEFSVAAEEGLDMAQYNLGILYFYGQGVEKDMEVAFKWTLAAAEQGHVAAQYNLGSLYFTGDGTPKSEEKGREWYASAGYAGHADAAFIMASLYEEGDSVDVDEVQAHAWASVAIGNEHVGAQSLRDSLEGRMNADQLSQARRLFARWQIR